MPASTAGRQNRRRGTVCERSSSFPRESSAKMEPEKLMRLKREQDFSLRSGVALGELSSPEIKLKPTKMLIKVTMQGSSVPVHVVMPAESTVSDVITASLRQYKKEGRRPLLASIDSSPFDLHYSQFCLESLQKETKLAALDSRNFFLCRKKLPPARNIKIEWSEFMNFSDFVM